MGPLLRFCREVKLNGVLSLPALLLNFPNILLTKGGRGNHGVNPFTWVFNVRRN